MTETEYATGDEAAQAAAVEAVEAGSSEASAQTEGQIENPHGPDNHVDSWEASRQDDGSIEVEKGHAS